tara:strand:- start:314 stop:970 length:657 start_codon:yes stop_codon:yes gene_type:complete
MSNEQQNYYAVIPSHILNAKDLISDEKLLYALVASLSNETGYCFASNAYFAKKFGKSKRSIERWMKSLLSKGYITSKKIYEKGTKQIISRYLSIAQDGGTPTDKNVAPPTDKNGGTPTDKNGGDSIKEEEGFKEEINICEKNSFKVPSLSKIEAFIKEKGYNVDAKGFFTYYDADNWRGVKSWKRRVATFHNNSQKHTHSKKTTTTIDDMYKALEGVT